MAGRLRAIIHFDISGSWRVAEQMESVASRDIGLVDYEELYATRCAGCEKYVTGTVLHAMGEDWYDALLHPCSLL